MLWHLRDNKLYCGVAQASADLVCGSGRVPRDAIVVPAGRRQLRLRRVLLVLERLVAELRGVAGVACMHRRTMVFVMYAMGSQHEPFTGRRTYTHDVRSPFSAW